MIANRVIGGTLDQMWPGESLPTVTVVIPADRAARHIEVVEARGPGNTAELVELRS